MLKAPNRISLFGYFGGFKFYIAEALQNSQMSKIKQPPRREARPTGPAGPVLCVFYTALKVGFQAP